MSITLSSTKKNIRITHPHKKTSHVFIAGIGAVGGTLIDQIKKLNNPELHIAISGVCNSKQVVWNPNIQSTDSDFFRSSEKTNWEEITNRLIQQRIKSLIFIDTTGSEEVARQYLKLLSNGVHIVTPSKRANTFEQSYFDELISIPKKGFASYKYETAVGAGLPVISTLNNLIESGDHVSKISGVLSGTMTYIFHELQKGTSFSKIIRDAKNKGYSEPDPRDDLSGEDVARKFLILARTCGFKFERKQIEVESLVPKDLIDSSVDDFFNQLSSYDDHWKNQHTQALLNNKKLRYTGTFTPDKITIGVQTVSSDSPLGGLKGTDNLIQIFTRRYPTSPILIQGPGAGKEVTAAGILSDVLEIVRNTQ